MKCPTCGTENYPSVVICARCGAPLARSTPQASAAGAPAYLSASLVVQQGPQVGRAYPLHPGANTVGRAAANTIVLPEPSVSRHHARVIVQSEGVWIQDVGSTVGTYVNGQRLTGSAWLHDGDCLQIGGVVLLGVQIVPVQAVEFGVAPQTPEPRREQRPPTAATGLRCPRCGAHNQSGVRFCGQCAAPLTVGATPTGPEEARPKRRRRRWLIAAGIALPVLIVGSLLVVFVLRARTGVAGDSAQLSQDDVVQTATDLVGEHFPEFADDTPTVVEVDFAGDPGYQIVYDASRTVDTALGPVEFARRLVVSVNSVSGQVSAAVSQ